MVRGDGVLKERSQWTQSRISQSCTKHAPVSLTKINAPCYIRVRKKSMINIYDKYEISNKTISD